MGSIKMPYPLTSISEKTTAGLERSSNNASLDSHFPCLQPPLHAQQNMLHFPWPQQGVALVQSLHTFGVRLELGQHSPATSSTTITTKVTARRSSVFFPFLVAINLKSAN